MFVYLIQNSVNKKVYVGMHVGADLRRYFNWKLAQARRGYRGHLYNAIRSAGENKFSIISIHSFAPSAITRKELGVLESYYIKAFRSNQPDVGYNLTDGGEGASGYSASLEQRQWRSEYMKGNKRGHFAVGRPANSGTFRRGHKGHHNSGSFKPGHKLSEGRVCSDETRKKMSASRKGKRLSTKTEFRKGQMPWNKGIPMSEEQRVKLRDVHVGKPLSAEHRKKLSESHKGRIVSEETRRKMSVINKGKTLSPEHREKLRIAHTGKTLTPEHRAKLCGRIPWNKKNKPHD